MIRSARRKSKNSRSDLIKRIDKIASLCVRSLGACEASGVLSGECWGDLQCHHISKRRHLANRFKPHNLVCLCARHHNMMESKECEASLLAVIRTKDQINELNECQNDIVKDDLDLLVWLGYWSAKRKAVA